MFAAAGALALLAAGVIAWLMDPVKPQRLLPDCMLLSLTGLYCPGCGVTRAAAALAHGRLIDAAGYNLPAVLIGFPAAGWLLLNWLSIAMRGCPVPAPRLSSRFAFFLVAFIILFWILRNIPVYPFTILAP